MILKYSHNRRDNPCGCPLILFYMKFVADRGKPCPYGIISNSICASAPSLRGLSFFVPKNDSSLYKGAFDGQPQATALHRWM